MYPSNIHLRHHLQTLAAAAWMLFFGGFIGFFGLFICLYLLRTNYWWLSVSYMCWIYLDRNICETGSRPSKWVRNWTWWRYVRDYFTPHLLLDSGCELDPKKNYLFCCFPHGAVPAGPFVNILTQANEFHQRFPQMTVYMSMRQAYFLAPIARELYVTVGAVSCSRQSLNYVLSKPDGGNVIILHPGGSRESVHSYPGRYTFLVKNRKGFIRIALKNGTALVPVITFGEVDLFRPVQNFVVCKLKRVLERYFQYVPGPFVGRGFFQNNVGIIPKRITLTSVVGNPIQVPKIENPTNDTVEKFHHIFMNELVNLFERFKYTYLPNPKDTKLQLV